MDTKLNATQEEINTLLKNLPLINKINNDELRELVIETWIRFWRESPYKNIEEAPNYLSEIGCADILVRHTSAVAQMVEAIALIFQQIYCTHLNFDFLLAGALLHDVDKLLLYEQIRGKVQLTELGNKVSHGEYGAHIADQFGFPKEVTNIIASHSPIQRKALPATIEAVFVCCCDVANFQAFRLMSGKELYRKVL